MTTATLISAPAPEPVSLAMAKLQCRVEHSDEDALIGSIIVAMREQAETALGRPLGLQTWRVEADGQPQGTALLLERIPGVPLADVTAIAVVEYRDEAGAWQTMPPADYALDARDPTRCWLRLAPGAAWPVTDGGMAAMRVDVAAGIDPVPETIVQWMLLQIGTAYKFREGVVAGVSLAELPGRYTDGLLDGFRIVTV